MSILNVLKGNIFVERAYSVRMDDHPRVGGGLWALMFLRLECGLIGPSTNPCVRVCVCGLWVEWITQTRLNAFQLCFFFLGRSPFHMLAF